MFHAFMLWIGLSQPYFHTGDIVCLTSIEDENEPNEFGTRSITEELTISKIEKVGKQDYLRTFFFRNRSSNAGKWAYKAGEISISAGDDIYHICTKEELVSVGLK